MAAKKPAGKKTSASKGASASKKKRASPRGKRSKPKSFLGKALAGLGALILAIAVAVARHFENSDFFDWSRTAPPPGDAGLVGQEAWAAEHLRFGAPVLAAGNSSDSTLIIREGYALSHDNPRQIAHWVSYRLDAADYEPKMEREPGFYPDPDIPGNVGEHDDYTGSGYDRGHLAPAADMRKSRQVQRESFYLSNCAPQTPKLNRGEWRKLEEQTRRWASEKGQLWVMAGPAFDPGREPETIGDGVAVPHRFWKVIVDESPSGKLTAAAFLAPNSKSPPAWGKWRVSIDQVEAATGLDLLPDLPDDVEDALEASVDSANWR